MMGEEKEIRRRAALNGFSRYSIKCIVSYGMVPTIKY